MKKIQWEKLNKLISNGKVVCLIECENSGFPLTVREWRWLEPNEDYADPQDECYQYADGSYCGLVAYVTVMNEHIPFTSITKILTGELKLTELK